jgi:ABC-2 type transport system ATP-binding protein
MTDIALEIEGLTKTYGTQTVLRDLSLTAAAGEIYGLLGANGAGKTTAVEIAQGLRSRDGGRVRVLGVDPARDRRRLRHLVGAQLQSSALPDRLRVGEALRLFARLAGDVVDWRALRDDWGLGPLARRPFGALSGGERQRLFVALALVNRPRLVFLDELTQGLDAGARRATWQLVEQVRDQGATVVLVSHFMDEAERLCDRVGVLHQGRIVAAGRPGDVVAAVGGHVHVRFSLPDAEVAAAERDRWRRLPGVSDVFGVDPCRSPTRTDAEDPKAVASGGSTVDIACAAAAVVPLIAEIDRAGLAPTDLTVVRPTLEDAFVALTGTGTDGDGDDGRAGAADHDRPGVRATAGDPHRPTTEEAA